MGDVRRWAQDVALNDIWSCRSRELKGRLCFEIETVLSEISPHCPQSVEDVEQVRPCSRRAQVAKGRVALSSRGSVSTEIYGHNSPTAATCRRKVTRPTARCQIIRWLRDISLGGPRIRGMGPLGESCSTSLFTPPSRSFPSLYASRRLHGCP